MDEPARYLARPRVLYGAAALTVAASVAAVFGVREIAVRILHPNPSFTPLSLGSPIVATVGCTAMAIYVFVGMASSPKAVGTWRKVSALVLILSFLPCAFMAVSHIMSARWPEALALMAMHVAVWAVCATLLPSFATTGHPPNPQPADRPLSIL